MEALEDSSAPHQHWDQFERNKALFGVETTFSEEFYTTKLDKSTAKISEAEAARLEREILSAARQGSNSHMNEERGFVDDSQARAPKRAQRSVACPNPRAPEQGRARDWDPLRASSFSAQRFKHHTASLRPAACNAALHREGRAGCCSASLQGGGDHARG
jgi:LsmAD domain